MLNFYQHSIFSDDYHFVFVYAKIRRPKRLMMTSVLAGRTALPTHALIGNVGDGNFRPPFLKKAISQQWTDWLW